MIDLVLPEDGVYVIEVFPTFKPAADVRGEYELYVFRYVEEDAPPKVPGLCALALLALTSALLGAGVPALRGSWEGEAPPSGCSAYRHRRWAASCVSDRL